MKHDTLSWHTYVKMFIFKVTKCILSNYHMHCSKKEPLPSVSWILVIRASLIGNYGNTEIYVQAESLLLHNTEPHATVAVAEPRSWDLDIALRGS